MKEKKLYLVRTSKLSKGFWFWGGNRHHFYHFLKWASDFNSSALLCCQVIKGKILCCQNLFPWLLKEKSKNKQSALFAFEEFWAINNWHAKDSTDWFFGENKAYLSWNFLHFIISQRAGSSPAFLFIFPFPLTPDRPGKSETYLEAIRKNIEWLKKHNKEEGKDGETCPHVRH